MMKSIGILVLIASTAFASDEYRTFTSEDGRQLKARILSYDSTSNKVQVEREDKKKMTVSASAFSENDQAYIKTWEMVQVFMSASTFKLAIEREELQLPKKEHTIDLETAVSSGPREGASGVITVAIDKSTQHKFSLIVENKSGVPLNNITVEYRIYYDQQKAIKDEKANKSRNENDSRPEFYKAVDQQKVKDGQKRVKTISPKEVRTVSSSSITLMKRSASRTWGNKIDLKSDLSGIWIKLTMKGADGERFVREIASPKKIPSAFLWDTPEE